MRTLSFIAPDTFSSKDRLLASGLLSDDAIRLAAPKDIQTCVFSLGHKAVVRPSRIPRSAAEVTDVLSTQDLVNGSLLAFALAFVFSALQSQQRPQSTKDDANNKVTNESVSNDNSTVFDSWKEMSRPENYVYYKTRVQKAKQETTRDTKPRTQRKWVLLSLLILFVPIFSAEFFLALSRQILCGGDPLTQSQWAAELCSPHY